MRQVRHEELSAGGRWMLWRGLRDDMQYGSEDGGDGEGIGKQM